MCRFTKMSMGLIYCSQITRIVKQLHLQQSFKASYHKTLTVASELHILNIVRPRSKNMRRTKT